MKILGIETSCDETGVAVIGLVDDTHLKLLSNVIASSMDLHRPYGGVVPEIAARSHIEAINPAIHKTLEEAGCDWKDVDGIAVTYGPGLGGSLLVGVLTARTLAILHNKPLYAVNHVEAHVYAAFISQASEQIEDSYKLTAKQPEFPLLALIVSGGHTQLTLFKNHFDYQTIGRTADDAIGEAYDKVAKMLGLPYPGGPNIEKLAKTGDKTKFKLPKPRMSSKYDFSYSGLKTAVLRTAQAAIGEDFNFPSHQLPSRLSGPQKADLAASFNQTAIEVLVDKTISAFDEFKPKSVVVAGGVSASPQLRQQLNEKLTIEPHFPDIKLCTDNGAMIAALGCYLAQAKKIVDAKSLEIAPNLIT